MTQTQRPQSTAEAVPERHPSTPVPVPAAMAMIGRLLGVRTPTAAEFARFGQLLTAGDPEMDALVDWMFQAGVKVTKPMFQQALTEGIAAVPNAPAPLREFFATYETVPDWVEPEKLRLAAVVMRTGGADGLYIARDVALIGGYQFSGFNQTLLRTGALEKGSNARFAETALWAQDVIRPGGLDPLGAGYRSTLHVRFIHSMVRRHVEAMPDWDSAQWGLPINQTDMAATLVGSLVAPSVGGLAMGIVNRPRDYEAIAHLTRYVGWLMGVQDDLLPLDFRDSVRLLIQTSTALATPDETTRQLAQPMADDPLVWRYERFAGLRRRIARNQHLSVTAGFLGPKAMHRLGLNPIVLPWYPLLRVPINLVRSVRKLRPGGLAEAAERGDAQSRKFLRTMTGETPTIGASSHIASHAA